MLAIDFFLLVGDLLSEYILFLCFEIDILFFFVFGMSDVMLYKSMVFFIMDVDMFLIYCVVW